jgi:hypothetical protein
LSVLTIWKDGEGKREFVDLAVPSHRLLRCPNCFAPLSETEERSSAAAKAG